MRITDGALDPYHCERCGACLTHESCDAACAVPVRIWFVARVLKRIFR